MYIYLIEKSNFFIMHFLKEPSSLLNRLRFHCVTISNIFLIRNLLVDTRYL